MTSILCILIVEHSHLACKERSRTAS